MNFSEISKRKVAGVPVLYLAAGFVAIIGVYAYKMKSTASPDDETTDETTDEETEGLNPPGESATGVYPNAPTGTVIVAPQENEPAEAPYEDNQTWMRKSVAFLIAKKSANPGSAQLALQLYLAGENLTYGQGVMRDQAISEYGLPPDIGDVGTTGPKPATSGPVSKPGPAPVPGPRTNPGPIPNPKSPVPKPRTPPVPKPKPKPVPAKPKPKPPAKPAGYHPKYPGWVLRVGTSHHTTTKIVQKRLGITQDGIYGPGTKAAVVKFQKAHRLTGDGQVGPLTWKAMFG